VSDEVDRAKSEAYKKEMPQPKSLVEAYRSNLFEGENTGFS
jgi:hypothetical protein